MNYNAKPVQILLAWAIRSGDVIAIPKAVHEEHVIENAQAASVELTEEDLAKLDTVFLAPDRKVSLDIL